MHYENVYEIADIDLADNGLSRIEWARAHMPITVAIGEAFQTTLPFKNKHISICLHVEAKTAVWLEALQKGGATISITGSPGTTQDDTAAALVKYLGVSVFSRRDETLQEHLDFCRKVLDQNPDLISDNGADLHAIIMDDPSYTYLVDHILGATEETTTGATRLREDFVQADFPTLVINDTKAKRIVENRFGVGSSVVDGIMRATNSMLHGKNAVVVGYGFCGSGVAQRLRGMGAHVTVVENDPLICLEAHLEGFRTSLLQDAVTVADLILTVTGRDNILTKEHFRHMKDGVILANAGHFSSEIDCTSLEKQSLEIKKIREHVTRYLMPDETNIFLLAGGNPINLAAGDGNPIEIMDLGLALQSLSLERLATEVNLLSPGPQTVPSDIEQRVAQAALDCWAR